MASRFRYVYRIVSNKYPAFDGSGAHKWGSRWVDPGRYVIHAASQYSLGLLENLVHWNTTQLPTNMVCVVAEIPVSLAQSTAPTGKFNSVDQCRKIGNRWYDNSDEVALWVPSVISRYEQNVLINQTHPEFSKIKIHTPVPANIDARLLKK